MKKIRTLLSIIFSGMTNAGLAVPCDSVKPANNYKE